VSGVLMALFQSNAGGAWDNAKKSFEKGVDINGQMYYKGSDPHKAAVTGDTVGDPFKDTSGPSMNILIKLTAIVSLVIAPLLMSHANNAATKATVETQAATTAETMGAAANLSAMKGNFTVDAGHSFVDFSIKHWMSRARGNMGVDTGRIVLTGDPATSSIFIQLNTNSINTSSKDRDETLRSADWFDAAGHPAITFHASKIETSSAGEHFAYKAVGDLTMKGATHPATMWFNYLGETTTPKGQKVYSFEGESKINRTDFGVGGTNLPFLGDEVKIEFSVEAQ
jgi:polyisoprenoid-binding protein YceI